MLFLNNVSYKMIWMDLKIKGFQFPETKGKEEKIMNEDHLWAKTLLFLITQILLLTLVF